MFSKASVEDLRAVLTAYRTVKNGSWPQMHAAMDRRAPHWALAGERVPHGVGGLWELPTPG